MRLIIILLLSLCLCGCCAIAGMGMKSAREERAAREDAFHEKLGNIFDRVAK